MTEPLTTVYFPLALGLGVLHALEPGHAKTMMAAYLIGVKGTKRDALFLGLSAAATHSIVVIAIAVAGMFAGQRLLADHAARWLETGSGVVVMAIGAWMIWNRWPRRAGHAPHHHGAPEAVDVDAKHAAGTLTIIDTPGGERLVFAATRIEADCSVRVVINRPGQADEILDLRTATGVVNEFVSESAPQEPHEFSATLMLTVNGVGERVPFAMHEPEGHDHHHEHLDDDAHARAHAAAMPKYVKTGGRPSLAQVIAFGAAGGMIPCPASITVMLLAIATGRAALGILAVLCFSAGLAIALVGIGMLVVVGVGRVNRSGRFDGIIRRAPVLSAVAVMASGLAAVLVAH